MSGTGFGGRVRRVALWVSLSTLCGLMLLITGPARAQASPPPLPSAMRGFAWFGCNSLAVSGNTKVYGVTSVGGAPGLEGNVGSNGGITISGHNTIAGDATPGPGQVVHVSGGSSQVQGSTAPAASTLTCEEVSVADWASYASANNHNSAIPSQYLDSSRNFMLNGNKTCMLPAGTYYLNNVTVNGNSQLTLSGPVVIVATGALTFNGNSQTNQGGDPEALTFICTSSSAVTLNGGVKVDMKVFAPLSAVSVNGTLTGYGELWGESFTGNGNVTWNRLYDTTPPTITITGVTDGSWYNTDVTAQVTVTDPHLDPHSVSITLNGQPYVSGTAISTDGYYVLAVSASDTYGNSAQAAVSFAIDKAPPAITVSTPADNAMVNATPATLSGYVMDANPETLTINGNPVGSPGQSSFSAQVPLTEGADVIALVATDRAGNVGSLTWHVTLKTTPPTVAISQPIDGLITRSSSITVSGTASSDAVSVDVNGKFASLAGGSFTVNQVALAEGSNALTATAKDAAGNTATAAVHVTKDTQGPAISIGSPADGSHTSAGTVTVSGTVTGTGPLAATLNGSPLPLSGGSFSQQASLVPGANMITVAATDGAGNSASRTITVTQDTGSLAVLGMTPASGSTGISTTAQVQVSFTRGVLENSVTSDTFQVSAGQSVAGAYVVQGSTVTFLPASAFPENTQVSVSLSSGITDLSGNALTPYTASFTTLGSTQAGLSVSLDSIPPFVNHSPLTITGTTSAGATVTVTGGANPVTATAGADGRFSVDLPLDPAGPNTFTAQASLASAQSPSVPFSVAYDATAPTVTNFSLDGSDLLVDFSEAVLESTVTDQSVSLTESGQPVSSSYGLELSGTRLRITPATPLGTAPAVLTVSTGVTDLAGNALAQPYTKTFNGGSAGNAFVVGEVYDDATGLPLPGASVGLVGQGAQAASGVMGAWDLPVTSGEAQVHLSASGYSDAYRTVSVDAGAIQPALDARLTVLSAQVQTLGSAGGTATFAGGQVTLTAPSGAFSQDTALTVTSLTAQGLPFPLPVGFSPLSAFRLDAAQAPSSSLTLSFPAPAGLAAGTAPCAWFDTQGLQWMGLTGQSDGTHVSVSVPAAPPPFTVVLLRLDDSPTPPPAVQDGAALSGVTSAPLDSATASLAANPPTILPDGKAQATVTITPAASISSGLPFAVTATESLDVREGTGTVTHHFSPYTEALTAYQDPANPSNQTVTFPVSPFPGIDVLTLLQGRIGISVGPYWPGPLGGGIIDSSGGTVDGAGGTHARIPAGATANPLPVRVFPVSQGSLLSPIPQGFVFLGGVELDLGGASLSSPAVLSIDTSALAAPVADGDTVVVAQARTLGGVAMLTLTDFATLNGEQIETLSGSGYPSELSGLPWPMVQNEGRYVFLKATSPVGFITGLVTDGTNPVAGAVAGVVSTTEAARRNEGSKGFTAETQRAQSSGEQGVGAASSPRSSSSASSALKSQVSALVARGKAPKASESLIDLPNINFLTSSDGRYAVPALIGTSSLEAVHVLSGDSGTASAAISTPAPPVLPVISQDIAIQAAPLAVVSSFPSDGDQNVPLGAELTVTFSKGIDPASVTAQSFAVTASGGALTGTLRIGGVGASIAFTPDAPLPSGSPISVEVSGITDRMGRALPSPFSFSFTTQVVAPPRLDPGKIQALLPNSSGQICVQGGPGAVEGGATVYLVNASHYEVGTATVNAADDGSFTVCLQGAIGDTIELHVVVPGSQDRVYTFTQLVSSDHQSVSMGPDGGTFTSLDASGQPLATIVVPAGAFSGPATIGLHPGDPSQTAPTPSGFSASTPLSIELSVPASKEIQLLLPAPGGWDVTDASKAFWLVRTVQVGGANPTQAPMVVDTMRASGCTSGSGNCLVTSSAPFLPGVRQSGLVQLYALTASQWGFITGGVEVSHSLSLLVTLDGLPFVALTDASAGWRYALPAPVGGGAFRESSGTFTLLIDDAQTWAQVLEQTLTGVTLTPGTPSDVGVQTDDHTPPFPLMASPVEVMAVQIKRLTGDMTSKIHYQVTDSNGDGLPGADETVAITGDAGAAPASAALVLADLSKPGSASLTATADGTGAFTFGGITLQGGDPGDILVLSIGQVEVDPQVPISVTFSRALGGDFTDPGSYPIGITKQGDTASVEGAPSLDSTRRVLTFLPGSAWEAGTTYEVTFPGLRDAAGDAFPQDFKADFTTSAGAATTGSVANIGIFRAAAVRGSLLFVGTQQNGQEGIAIIDVSKPDTPVLLTFVQTTGVVRSLTTADIDDPNHSGQLTPVLVAVGGGESGMGFLSAYEISGTAPYLTFFGGNQLSCAINASPDDPNCQDADGDSRNGEPISVQAVGNFAYASVLGYGVEGVDLRTLAQTTQWPEVWKGDGGERIGAKVRMLGLHVKTGHLIVPLGNGNLRVLTPDSADPAKLSDTGIGSYPCPQAGAPGCPCPGQFSTNGRLGLCLAENWITYRKSDANAAPEPNPAKDLAFIPDANNGIAVFDVSYEGSPAFYMRFGLAESGCGALDTFSAVSFNPREGVLYAVGTAGLWVFDVAHLTRIEAAGQDPVALPVRLVSHDPGYTGPEAPLVDPGTGMAYMGLPSNAVGAVKVAEPHVQFLSNQQAQALTAVRREAVRALESDEAPVLDAVSADVDPADAWAPRIAAFVPGGAGSTLAVDVHSIARGGILRQAPAGNNPPTELAGTGQRDDHKDAALVLHRQSDDPSDPKFNFYLSDPFTPTYNMNKDAGASTAPLILAADTASANLSVDAPQNAGLAWLSPAQRQAAGTELPYLGIDYVDMDGNSLPAIDAMSLEMYQKAQYKAQGNTLGTITISNPVGVTLQIPNGLSDSTIDSVTATITDHQDSSVSETFTLTETGPNTLVFTINGPDGNPKVQLAILTTDDPDVPPVTPVFSAAVPDVLMVSASGTFGPSQEPFSTDQELIETGPDTLTFREEVIEAHLTLGNQDLPPSQASTITGTLRNLHGDIVSVSLTETAPGSRVFTDSQGGTSLTVEAVISDQNVLEAAPSPASIDTLRCLVTVPAWNVQGGVMELTEASEDDADYANEVDQTASTINDGFGEEQIPTLDDINNSYLPRKQFYIEVHDPKLAASANAQIHVTATKVDGTQETPTYNLAPVDGMRLRTATPVLLFDGPAFDPGTYETLSASKTRRTRGEALEAPPVSATATLAAQTIHVEATDAEGRAVQGDANCIGYAALGDSVSMGCLGGNTQASGQRNSGPVQFAQMLGLPMVLPLLSGKGNPPAVQPESGDQRLVIHNPLDFFVWHKGHRLNPGAVPNNLAITGADIRSITEDDTMCEDSGALSKLIFWAGSGEDMRQSVVVNGGQEKAPPDWLRNMDPMPSIVTIEAGANDALGVIIGTGGKIYEKDATLCNEAPDSGHARNLSTVDSFKNEYRMLITRLLDQYDGAEVKPALIFLTVPDVSVIPAGVKINRGNMIHPFTDGPIPSDFKATARLFFHNAKLDEYFRNATMDSTTVLHGPPCDGQGNCAMIGLIPFLKAALFNFRVAVSPAAAARKALGSESKPHPLTDDEVLTSDEVRELRGNIRGFNRSILELLYKEDWDSRLTQWRKEGRVRVFDLNYLLFLLAARGGVERGQEPPNSYTILDVAGDAGITDPSALAIITADKQAARSFYDNVARGTHLEATARGGVLGPDYVHPTPSGHRLIAMGELYLLKSAAATLPTCTLGGFRQQTLEEKFKEAQDGLQGYINADKWVPKERKSP